MCHLSFFWYPFKHSSQKRLLNGKLFDFHYRSFGDRKHIVIQLTVLVARSTYLNLNCSLIGFDIVILVKEAS